MQQMQIFCVILIKARIIHNEPQISKVSNGMHTIRRNQDEQNGTALPVLRAR